MWRRKKIYIKKQASCGFDYSGADPELGSLEAKSLFDYLSSSILTKSRFPSVVVEHEPGKNSVTVHHEGLNKGGFLEMLFEDVYNNNNNSSSDVINSIARRDAGGRPPPRIEGSGVDFVLCVGSGSTDLVA